MKIILHLLLLLTGLVWAGCNEGDSTATVSASPASPTDTAQVPDKACIQRIVCFRFKPGISAEAREQHMRGFAGLKDSIPYILTYRAGPTVIADMGEKPEYDVMHYTTYRSEEEIRLYSVHPVHQRFIQVNKEAWEKVLVINSLFGGAGEDNY